MQMNHYAGKSEHCTFVSSLFAFCIMNIVLEFMWILAVGGASPEETQSHVLTADTPERRTEGQLTHMTDGVGAGDMRS